MADEKEPKRDDKPASNRSERVAEEIIAQGGGPAGKPQPAPAPRPHP